MMIKWTIKYHIIYDNQPQKALKLVPSGFVYIRWVISVICATKDCIKFNEMCIL